MAKPVAPHSSPVINVRRSPSRAVIGLTSVPCTIMAQTPTAASVNPTADGPQPYR